MPLAFRIFSVFLVFIVLSFAMSRIASVLVGQKLTWRQYLLFCAGLCAIEWMRVGIDIVIELNEITEPLWKIASYCLLSLLLCIILRRMYRVPLDRAFAAAALGNFITYTIYDFLVDALYVYSPRFDGKYLYVVTTIYLPYLLMLIIVEAIVFILNKTNFYQYFVHLFQGRLRTAVTLAVCFLLMNMKLLMDCFFPDSTTDIVYGMFCFALIVLALFFIQFGAMYAANSDKVKAQEETIAQQQAHMELLEELQNEIRAFRHDFMNLISGMTLSAQDGDVNAIQEFMKHTSLYFDEKLGNEIRQMEGLSNIKIYPVRSLIFAKLNLMRQRHIQVMMEIMKPVTDVRMPVGDILRCLGILLDNAIEAAAEEDGKIRIVLLQDAGELYIAIANNYDVQPKLGELSESGYTTKGKGHGMGLSSYRKIVSRCPGCVTRTYLKEDFLVQELRIPV